MAYRSPLGSGVFFLFKLHASHKAPQIEEWKCSFSMSFTCSKKKLAFSKNEMHSDRMHSWKTPAKRFKSGRSRFNYITEIWKNVENWVISIDYRMNETEKKSKARRETEWARVDNRFISLEAKWEREREGDRKKEIRPIEDFLLITELAHFAFRLKRRILAFTHWNFDLFFSKNAIYADFVKIFFSSSPQFRARFSIFLLLRLFCVFYRIKIAFALKWIVKIVGCAYAAVV